MEKKGFCSIFVAAVVIVLASASAGLAAPTNGDFSEELAVGWTVDSGIVTRVGELARFEEDTSSQYSILSQQFEMPDDAATLSFYVDFNSVSQEGTPDTDVFTAHIDDEQIFYLDNDEEKYVSGTVTVDVSEFQGLDVLLRFSLFGDFDNWLTTVELDDVVVNESAVVIPAPGALLLASVGTAFVGWLRRSQKLR